MPSSASNVPENRSDSIPDPADDSLPPPFRAGNSRRKLTPALRILKFLSGFALATTLLLLLLVLTWLATLEQIEVGLNATLLKYFSWQSWYLIPRINDKVIPIVLPGGYWVCALLLLNLTLGGFLRMRKGLKQIGVLIAHFGIIFMLVAGGVAHHFSDRGNMAIYPGDTSNTAESYTEYVVEIAEIKNDKPTEFYVIRGEHLTGIDAGESREFSFPEIPFNLRISSYLSNSQLVTGNGPSTIDGYTVKELPDDKTAERNIASCRAEVLVDGKPQETILLTGAAFQPATIRVGDRIFIVDMRKRLWVMPFDVKVVDFMADFHPGTGVPSKFISDVVRIEGETSTDVRIEMNEPMRHHGLTFYQASYGPQGATQGDKLFTVFEVVRNPADQWPYYSMLIVGAGLLIHFVTKLTGHILSMNRKKSHA